MYYKVWQKNITSVSDVIQSMTIITKCDSTSMLRISGSLNGSLFNLVYSILNMILSTE